MATGARKDRPHGRDQGQDQGIARVDDADPGPVPGRDLAVDLREETGINVSAPAPGHAHDPRQYHDPDQDQQIVTITSAADPCLLKKRIIRLRIKLIITKKLRMIYMKVV